LYTNKGGKFEVLQNNKGEILVTYYVLGSKNEKHRTALVLETNKLPSRLYVTCSMAM
jgi:hypothetical protein